MYKRSPPQMAILLAAAILASCQTAPTTTADLSMTTPAERAFIESFDNDLARVRCSPRYYFWDAGRVPNSAFTYETGTALAPQMIYVAPLGTWARPYTIMSPTVDEIYEEAYKSSYGHELEAYRWGLNYLF